MVKTTKICMQDANTTGILFINLKPTITSSPAAGVVNKTLWFLDGRDGYSYGAIETGHLIDGKYLIYQLKAGIYKLSYWAILIGNSLPRKRVGNYYNIDFKINPGEILYCGDYKPKDEFVIIRQATRLITHYQFKEMSRTDNYVEDIKWLKARYGSLFEKFKPINYYKTMKFR